jgi:hypothetical protein
LLALVLLPVPLLSLFRRSRLGHLAAAAATAARGVLRLNKEARARSCGVGTRRRRRCGGGFCDRCE